MNEKLIAIRKALGVSATKMAVELGMSAKHYLNIEKGKAEIDDSLLIDKFHVNKDYLQGDDCRIFDISINNQCAQRIKKFRRKLNLTQKEFASITKIKQSTLSLIENGNCPLSTKMAERISNALDVGEEWLLYGNENDKDFPCNKKMIQFLKSNKEVRKSIYEIMKK